MPSNHLILCHPLLLLPSILPSISLFQWVSFSYQVTKVLELQLQHQSFQWTFRTHLLQDWLVWSPCSPRDSQESSLTPQFRSINSSLLSLLYGPTLTSIHDYWKSHSFGDQTPVGKQGATLVLGEPTHQKPNLCIHSGGSKVDSSGWVHYGGRGRVGFRSWSFHIQGANCSNHSLTKTR